MSKYAIILLCLFTGLGTGLWAQNQVEISGTISDEDGSPLAGATVLIAGTPIGAYTDSEGQFSLTTRGSQTVMVQATSLGYSPAEESVDLPAEGKATVDFTLKTDALGLDAVVLTGVANPRSKLNTSISISSVSPQIVNQASPRNTAEILRTIPGIRSESSAGEGNTNITVRGVPISAGGSKYVQLQEDGLPILLFGDIAFATSDIFLRSDYNVGRIEAIRGGTASTLASNSPAGIVNFISKHGLVEGGQVGFTTGLDYQSYRTDFEYGSPLGENLNFHVGGFFRSGEGVRSAGYNANVGGQLKANLTKRFDKGYVRLYYKMLNDRAAGYLPMPMQVTGTNDNPEWSSVDGFDILRGTIHSPFLRQNFGPGPNGAPRRADVADGMHPKSQSIGAEFSFDLDGGWSVEDRVRFSMNSGRFVSPFPAEVGQASSLATAIGGNGASLTYADDGTAFNTANGLAMRIHMFDTELNNFNNLVNDLRVNKSFGEGRYTVRAGVFTASQNISMSWLWNSYLSDVNGDGTRLLNVADSAGNMLTENGLTAYGVPFWGNCCTRGYDVSYEVIAPNAGVELQLTDDLNVDASFRWDLGSARGTFAGSSQSAMNVNGDDTLSVPEQSVSVINNAAPSYVDYDWDYVSYSVGVNYKLNSETAVFGRYSQGGSAKADRVLFNGLNYLDSDSVNAKDIITQAELGFKGRFDNFSVFATGFFAQTAEEGGFEATTQQIIENDYQAYGIELEGAVNVGDFDMRIGATFTDATITSGDNEGKTPRRQAALIFQAMPTYSFGSHTVGLSFFGTSSSFAQDNNELIMPGYVVTNLFANFQIVDNLTLGINANNLFNALGVTESEEGSITDNAVNYVRARPITGRTLSASVRFTF